MNATEQIILKNFSTINKSIRFNPTNKLCIFNETLGTFAIANIETEFPIQFSIYDLNQLLSTLALFNDPTIRYDKTQMLITGDRMNAKYRYSSASVTKDQRDELPPLPPELFTFTLTKEQLAEVLKASSVLALKELRFNQNSIQLFNTDNKGNIIDNEYQTDIDGVTVIDDSKKSITVKVDSLKLLPLDYMVTVHDRCVKFKSMNEQFDVTYVVAKIAD